MPDYVAAARQAARAAGIDPDIFVRQIQQESSFNPNARSKYAIGIAQITPDTARSWGVDPNDPIASLHASATHMADYIKTYGGWKNALIAYNAGPGKVGQPLYKETQNYIDTILGGHNPAPKKTSTTKTTTTAAPTSEAQTPQTDQTVTPFTLDRPTPVAVTAPTLPGFAQKGAARTAALAGTTAPDQSKRFNLTDALNKLASTQTAATSSATAAPSQTPSTTAKTSTAAKPKATAKAAKFEGRAVAGWIAPILTYAREHGWKGQVNSGLRSYAEQQRIWNSGVRPAAKPGTSNHEFTAYPGGAVDVSDAAQLSKILKNSPYAKLLVWAGGKDPVHFSHPHGGSY